MYEGYLLDLFPVYLYLLGGVVIEGTRGGY